MYGFLPKLLYSFVLNTTPRIGSVAVTVCHGPTTVPGGNACPGPATGRVGKALNRPAATRLLIVLQCWHCKLDCCGDMQAR